MAPSGVHSCSVRTPKHLSSVGTPKRVTVRVSVSYSFTVSVRVRARVGFGHSELILEFQHSELELRRFCYA